MGAWRHVKHSIAVEGCGVVERPSSWMCGCKTPTPDPASRCGVCGQGQYRTVHATDRLTGRRHPHRPTTCARCGHAITEAP